MKVLSKEQTECKGLFYRYKEHHFRDSKGAFVLKKLVFKLKSISCPGCEKCGWVEETMEELLLSDDQLPFDFPEGIKNFDTLELIWSCSGEMEDWECNFVFRKIEP